MPVLSSNFWLWICAYGLLRPVLSFAFFYEDPQENKVGYPGKYDLKSNVHQEICQEVMWVGEDVNPSIHSEPPFLVLGHQEV